MGFLNIFKRPAPVTEKAAGLLMDTTTATVNPSLLFGAPRVAGVAVGESEILASVAGCCISVISDAVASLELGLRRADGMPLSPSKRKIDAMLRRRPSSFLSPYEWRRLVMNRLLMEGEAYLVIAWDASYRPLELIPIPRPTRMVTVDGDIVWNCATAQANLIVGPRLRAAGYKNFEINDFDVVAIRAIPILTEQGLRGWSPAMCARDAIGLAVATERHSSALFAAGARPGGVLSAKGKLSADAASRLRQSWDSMFGGVANSGRTAVLEEGLEWLPLAMTSIDAQTLEQRAFQVQEIARFFRVPLSKLGLSGGKQPAANAEAQAREFLDSCLRPHLENIESALENKLLFGDTEHDIEFDCDGLLRADFAARMQGYSAMRVAAICTVNEIRAKEGLPPLPGGDVLGMPLNSNVAPNQHPDSVAVNTAKPEPAAPVVDDKSEDEDEIDEE